MKQKCDSCGYSYLFMKLEKLNPYSDFMVCSRCLDFDKRKK